MIGYGAVLRLNLLSGKWWYTNMFTSSNIQVSHAFTIIGLIAESTMKFINDYRSKIFGNLILEFQCGLCNESYHGECMRHLNVRIGRHIGIPPLTRKQVKPKNSSVADHFLICNHSAFYDDFSILTRENKTFFLKLTESLLTMRDKPSLNRNITLTPLYLFDQA